MILLPKWAQVLSQRALTTEHYCLWVWAGRDDCFQLYNLQPCTLCATSLQLLFEGGLHIPTLRVFLLEKPALWRLQLRFSGILCKTSAETTGISCTHKLKKAKKVYTSVGKQLTPSQGLVSEISKDSVLSPKPCWGFSCLSCSISFFCCWLASCTEDQLLVTTAAFRVCNGRSQSSAVLVCMPSALPFRQGG